MLDVQVGAIEAADDPAEVVKVIAAVPQLPALLADQVARNGVRERDTAAQAKRERGPGPIGREFLEDRPVWLGLGGQIGLLQELVGCPVVSAWLQGESLPV